MKKRIIITALLAFAYCAQAQNVVELEYFIDTDAGIGQNTVVAVTPSPDGNFPFTASLTGITPGYHKLYTRVKDSDGKWGLTSWKSIEVVENEGVSNIASAEYFFNTDPGFGNGTPVSFSSPAPDGSFTFTIPVVQLTTGNTRLYVRAKNGVEETFSLTAWKDISITFSTSIEEVAGSSFQLFPNPSQGSVHLRFSEQPQPGTTVLITGIDGTVLQRHNIIENDSQISLPYASGIYLLKLLSAGKSTTAQIILNNN